MINVQNFSYFDNLFAEQLCRAADDIYLFISLIGGLYTDIKTSFCAVFT